MSVDPKHIDFGAITNAAAKKVLPNTKVSGSDGHKIDFAAATEEGLKKKEPAQSATTPPASSAGAGTPISTLPLSDPTKPFDFTPKWEGISEDEANYKGFRNSDKSLLDNLLQKHKVYGDPLASIRNNLGLPEVQGIIPQVSTRPFFKEYEAAKALESSIQEKIKNTPSETTVFTMPGAGGTPIPSKKETDLENDLAEAQNLRKKAWRELVIEGENKVDAVVRTDQSGNLLKKTFNRLLATNPTSSSLAGAAMSLEVQDKINKLPSQFVTGLNYLKGVEPVEYERITQALSKGMPISESQIANITAQGIDIEEERLKKNQRDKIISPDEFNKKAQELYEVKKKNLVDNEEVLRAFLSNGIAEMGDEIGKASQVGNVLSPQKQVTDYLFGHTWNYSDDEIKKYGETYAKQNGIDPSSPQVQKAIKYLQDNEGAMIMQNSIAKAGGIREFFKGAADPIRGVSNFIEDLGKSSNDVYAEAQSQGNVNVSEKRLKAEDTGVRGVINEVLKGTGQFATQAGMMYGVSGGIGALAEGIAGKAGAEMLAASRAANIKPVIAFDDATGKLALSNVLNNAKNPLSVFTTSYAMAYDSNLKQALQYTSDNSLAKKAAAFNSTMEGLTELALSPLEIAEGIVHKFTKGQTKDLLKILSDKSLKSDPSKLTQYATKFVKGVLGTSKVAGAEIGEELVTQISDYATNAYLNPNSESFKNRDLADELMTTAYQTGLTMAIPSLLNGISSAKANTFSKGSLMVAAQNRQKMIDAYKQDFANGKIDQNQLNANISLINTAAQANAELPKKADGTSLTTNEKADYIFSRVTEAMLQNKANRVKDAAEKQIISKQILEQQNYRAAILGNEKIEQDPVYKVDGNDVTKSQFIKMAKDENSDEHNFEVENDDATKAQFQKIAGVDKSQIPPAEQVKNENIELLQTLKGKETIPEFEYNAIVSNPDLALREIADQALGFTREGQTRVPHEFGAQEEQARKKYGDAVVDRALQLYPAEKTEDGATETKNGEPVQQTAEGAKEQSTESTVQQSAADAGQRNAEVATPVLNVFDAIESAAETKKSVREKNLAMAKAATEYGIEGERAMVISSNFDSIVSHLKSNNKIQVRCP